MYEILWMLLPVAAGAGWFAGRRSLSKRAPDKLWSYATSYHRDLHLLLSDRQMDGESADSPEFHNLGDIDHDAAETHLALGNLFRRRGDVERAIQVHGSLIDKQELNDDVRADARLELARDYDSAGLIDRAEELFKILLSENQHVEDCYENLLLIYERASDWHRAIDLADEYQSRCHCDLGDRVSHYHCELAEDARKENDMAGMENLLNAALTRNPQCARTNILCAELALSRDDFGEAIERYECVEKYRPELLPEIISPLFNALEQLGDKQRLRDYVERIRSRYNAYSVIKTTRDMIEKLDGPQMSDLFFKEQILSLIHISEPTRPY